MQPRQHPLRVGVARVEAAPRPAHQVQAQAVQHRVEERVAQAGRGTEAVRRHAGEVGQQRLRGADLALAAARAEQREVVTVAQAVVLHAVAGGHDAPHQRRVRARPLGDAEEGGAHALRGQQVEHGRA